MTDQVETATGRDRDWLPWIVLGIVAVALAALVLLKKREEAAASHIAERTQQSGIPLTDAQKALRFDAADLTFEVFPVKRAIEGAAKLDFTATAPADKVQLDLDPRYEIRAVRAAGAPVQDGDWRNEGGLLTVALQKPLSAGEKVRVEIDYRGTPHVAKHAPWDGGFVWSKTADGKPWVASAVQGEGCDMFWPCYDNATIEVGTVTQHIIVPEGLAAPSNGRLVGVDTLDDKRTRWNWVAKSPNNYAIAIDVGPYEKIERRYKSRYGNTIPIQYWHIADKAKAKQANALADEMVRTVAIFEDLVGPYPFGDEKVGVVDTPHLGMEHQTINAYGNGYKPGPFAYDWLFNHEFAHEWFGNQLTNSDWDDMWLHESFGSYMQPWSLERMHGRMLYDAALWDQRSKITNRNPIVFGRHRTEHEVYDAVNGSGQDIYNKGSWMLHTLRGLIGDAAFSRSVRRLVYGTATPVPGQFKPRFSSSDEFRRIVNEESGRDLGWFFDIYLRQKLLPRLDARQVGNRLELQWMTPGGRNFPMPVEVRVGDSVQTLAMANGRGAVTLPSETTSWTLDPQTKILRQIDGIDAYRDYVAKQASAGSKKA